MVPETFVAKFLVRGTKVLVSNASHVLFEHEMKNDFRIFAHDIVVDPTIMFIFPYTDGRTVGKRLTDVQPDFEAVATGVPRWPYIVYRALSTECRVMPKLRTPTAGRRP